MNASQFTPQEQPAVIDSPTRRITVGVPSPTPDDPRVPLTPEGVEILSERGYTVNLQAGAGATIHYPDTRYTRRGARIVDRATALASDVVLAPRPLTPADAKGLKNGGSLLISRFSNRAWNPLTVEALLRHRTTAIALDLIADPVHPSHHPFADILAEIDGRAAIVAASARLADPAIGKGILLGGIAGIVPCEVVIIGSGIAANAAARTAAGLGAQIKIFDNDVYSLRRTLRDLAPTTPVAGSTLQPNTILNSLRTADIVVVTPSDTRLEIDADAVNAMKEGVIILDISNAPGRTFPSLPTRRAADMVAFDSRQVLTDPGALTARTTAMALSNTLLTLFEQFAAASDSLPQALRQNPGLRPAALTFLGHIVSPRLAQFANRRAVDIEIYLSLS